MNRLILVSNRLPFALERAGTDEWIVTLSAGGLVSALAPVLRGRGGTWIGWPGVAGDIPNAPFAEATRDAGYEVVPVALSEAERDEFYYGYSNEVIWPLFRDLQNFLQCVRRVLPDAEVLPSSGLQRIRFSGRTIRAGSFPIGIDFESFEKGAASEEVARRARELRATFPGCQLMLGVDRLDYSKGIPERLRAFRVALERHQELRGRVVLIQAVVPSRVEIPRYHEFKGRID